jgi:hypothetical protein
MDVVSTFNDFPASRLSFIEVELREVLCCSLSDGLPGHRNEGLGRVAPKMIDNALYQFDWLRPHAWQWSEQALTPMAECHACLMLREPGERVFVHSCLPFHERSSIPKVVRRRPRDIVCPSALLSGYSPDWRGRNSAVFLIETVSQVHEVQYDHALESPRVRATREQLRRYGVLYE